MEFLTRVVDMAMTVGGTILAFHFYSDGDTQSAIFWILVAHFFGRGQMARYIRGE